MIVAIVTSLVLGWLWSISLGTRRSTLRVVSPLMVRVRTVRRDPAALAPDWYEEVPAAIWKSTTAKVVTEPPIGIQEEREEEAERPVAIARGVAMEVHQRAAL